MPFKNLYASSNLEESVGYESIGKYESNVVQGNLRV